jgi:hypothetical protein
MLLIIKNFYRTLMKKGWSLNQIDESDIFFLFDLFSEDTEAPENIVYADDVPWL